MKLGQVTKLDKKNKTTAEKVDDDIMSKNCDAIVIFPIYGQFGASREPDSGRILIFSLIVNFYLTKTTDRTKTSLTQLAQYCFE